MQHTHRFEPFQNGTKMIDVFEFESPFRVIGWMANQIFLKRYLTSFLISKNKELKRVAEGEGWEKVLGGNF